MKRLVLCVEGDGDVKAVPALVRRLLDEKGAGSDIFLDGNPLQVGPVSGLVKDDCHEWRRFLAASVKRPNVGGVLLLVDGDLESIGRTIFCAAEAARALASAAQNVGAGSLFSLAVVVARQEYESWLIAGFESLAGRRLNDGRQIHQQAQVPDGNLEAAPRDAKGWLNRHIEDGYKPTRDQKVLTTMVDLDLIRARELRSFQRLDSAVTSLLEAIRTGAPTVSPR